MAGIIERVPEGAGPVEFLVESMVIVATELIDDPLLKTISDQTDDRSVAQMLANNAGLAHMVEAAMEEMLKQEGAEQFRRNVRPKDLAQFLISTNISMLLGIIPGIEDPEMARRYIDVFVLPALVAHPPPPRAVFGDASG